jgi:hypothetical protein
MIYRWRTFASTMRPLIGGSCVERLPSSCVLTDEDDEDARECIYALILDLVRWARKNRVSQQATDELLCRLKRTSLGQTTDNQVPFPSTHKAAQKIFQAFEMLNISKFEMCENGCHRFNREEDGDIAKATCPVCGTPTRAEDGSRTTCTFSKFDLKDKLRLLYARPQFGELLTSHAKHVPDPNNMRGIYGTHGARYIYMHARSLCICVPVCFEIFSPYSRMFPCLRTVPSLA